MTPLSQQGYARHRRALRLPGGALLAVQQAITAGRIPVGPDGRIDPVAADAAWDANTDHTMVPHTQMTNGHGNGYHAASTLVEQKRLESFERTLKLKLENDRLTGRLVEADVLERIYGRRVVEARNFLRGLPSRIRMRIPALTPADLHIIAEEIDSSLSELADAPGRAAEKDD